MVAKFLLVTDNTTQNLLTEHQSNPRLPRYNLPPSLKIQKFVERGGRELAGIVLIQSFHTTFM